MGILNPHHLERHIINHFSKGPEAEFVRAHFGQALTPQQGFFGMKAPDVTREEFNEAIERLKETSKGIVHDQRRIDKFAQSIRQRYGWEESPRQEPTQKEAA